MGAQIDAAVAADAVQMPAVRRFTFSVGAGPRLMTAVEVMQEIPLVAGLQRLPNTPAVLAGVLNLRGAIRIVFDPLAALSLPLPEQPRRVLLIDRDPHCAGVYILDEPRLDSLQSCVGVAAQGPWAALARSVWKAADTEEYVLEIDHRAWFAQLRDLSQSA